MFQQRLISTFVANGYAQYVNDECILYRLTHAGQINFLSIHVDDILQVATCNELANDFSDILTRTLPRRTLAWNDYQSIIRSNHGGSESIGLDR